MKTQPLRILQTALGLKGDAVDGQYGPQTVSRIKRRLREFE